MLSKLLSDASGGDGRPSPSDPGPADGDRAATEGSRPPTETPDEQESGWRLPDPTNLALLGVLSIPGFLVPDLDQLRGFALFFLFGFWPLVAMLLPSREESGTDWVRTGDRWTTARFLLSTLALQVNPWVQTQALRQLAGHGAIYLRYRFDLPAPDSFDQRTTYRLPVEGEWTVVNGSHDRSASHSWSILGQRYAYDLVQTDAEGRTYTGDGDDPADYYCWDEPVVAPADGVVVAANDGHRDTPRTKGWLDLRQRDIRGNYVVVEHAGGEHSVLAHLREGSVAVAAGDRVVAGQRVGRCGHSGNSTEPHLHFHVQDDASFYRGMGLPVTFSHVAVASGPKEEVIRHDEAAVAVGQRVIHAPEAASVETTD
ncbi:M23 family metallopeptidase [Halomarina salina]|uniref:M23 family metallopeptidase n=1 Tax=Halomarina salina TaxID=1872699 RepID=A0ABD5RPE5_9EURY|nr:M23 family metallopeptidase [Halomarina salina]